MPKTNLESGVDWADLRYNPVQGLCPNIDCSIYADCYMKRPPFRFSVDRNPTLRLDEKKLMVKLPDEPQRIFVQDNLELFHEKTIQWVQPIIDRTKVYPQHTFIFLTKNPARYAEFDFPKNCWLGVTVTTCEEQSRIKVLCHRLNSPNVRFVSYEPLLGFIPIPYPVVDWMIVGALTGPRAHFHRPHRKWIELIINKAKRHDIPVFLKNNLKEVWGPDLIQEYPDTRRKR